MKGYATIAKTTKGQRDASLPKFGSKKFDGLLPNECILTPIHHDLSIPFYPLWGTAWPAHKKKPAKILITTRLRCAGMETIHRKWTQRMASLASNRRTANSMMVNGCQ